MENKTSFFETGISKVLFLLLVLSFIASIAILAVVFFQVKNTDVEDVATIPTVSTTLPDLPPAFSVDFEGLVDGEKLVSETRQVKVMIGSENDIEKVEFYLDGTLVATDDSYAFIYEIDPENVTFQVHTLKAIAYDTEGNKAEKEITFQRSEEM